MTTYELVPEWDDDYVVPDDDDDGDDNADQTGAFGPLSSTPAPEPEFQTAQKEKSGLPSFFEDQSELRLLRGRLTKSFQMLTKIRSNTWWIKKEG